MEMPQRKNMKVHCCIKRNRDGIFMEIVTFVCQQPFDVNCCCEPSTPKSFPSRTKENSGNIYEKHPLRSSNI